MIAAEGTSPHRSGAESQSSSARRVNGCSERLAGLRPKTPPLLPPLSTPKKLNKEEMDRHIHTVYNASVEKRKKTLASNEAAVKHREEQLLRYGGAKQMRSPSDVHEIVVRLGDDQVRMKASESARLQKQYEETYRAHNRTRINDPTGKESLSPRESKQSADKMYLKGMQRERDHMQLLVSKYCPPRTSPRRSPAELAASSNRLWRNEKR